jgi:hypothetical protein
MLAVSPRQTVILVLTTMGGFHISLLAWPKAPGKGSSSTQVTATKTGDNCTAGIKANGVENGEWNPTFAGMSWNFGARACALTWLAAVLTPAVAAEAPVLRDPSEMVVRQEPPKVVPRVDQLATPENTSIVVSLGRQRAYLLVDGEVAIDAPVSTGKRRGQTPVGEYTILEKAARHLSSLHGDFVDAEGRVFEQDGLRTGFKRPVAPGESITVRAHVRGPSEPGGRPG